MNEGRATWRGPFLVEVDYEEKHMKTLARGLLIAVFAVVAVALSAGTAAATIAPNPYSTVDGVGAFNTIWRLGNGNCHLSNVAVSASGATGTVTGFTASGCRGTHTAARFAGNMAIASNLGAGTVSLDFAYLMDSYIGGTCSYAGTLTGIPDGTDSLTVGGVVALTRTLGGVCVPTGDISLTLTLPGASIS